MQTQTHALMGSQKVPARSRLGVGSLPRLVIYQPLAVLLAILLLPPISWLGRGAGLNSSGPAPFQASAQTVGGCRPQQPNSIIQVVCPGGLFFAPDLYQLESDAVSDYLSEHNLPATDAHIIYDYGRSDLRSAVRASIFARLLIIINKPASQRTQHEQNLYSWLQYLTQQNEIAEYTAALNEFHTWRDDPCHYNLDPDIAAQYGLVYNGAPFCVGLGQLAIEPPAPAPSYFLAVGLKNSYAKVGQLDQQFAPIVAQIDLSQLNLLGILVGAAYVTGGATATAVSALIPAAAAEGATGFAGNASGAFAVCISGQTVALVGPEVAVLGPAGVVAIAVIVGIPAGMQAATNQQTIKDLNNLTNTLAQATNTPPDLQAFVSDSTGLGTFKLTETLATQTLPEVQSTAALPGSQAGIDPGFSVSISGGQPAFYQGIQYKDWNGLTWSVQASGGWFVQNCSGSSTVNCAQADSINAGINYVDWSGTQWTASRIGTNFVSTKAAPAPTDKACPADEATGVSPGSDFSNCLSYVSAAIPLTDPGGNHLSVSLARKPAFTSSPTFSFTTGQNASATITATGIPTPDISLSGALPAGFSFSPGNGTATLTYTGGAPAGTYQATVVAANGSGSVAQTLTIQVITQLSITSPSTMYVTGGLPATFTVTTTGDLPITLSINPTILQTTHLKFTDNGNGTATISGTPGSVGVFNTDGITATNASGSVDQSFGVFVSPPPQATLATPPNATFTVGFQNAILLQTTGAITQVDWFVDPYNMPSWLTFHNNGNGSAVLSGTPPAGSQGSYRFALSPYAYGTNFVVSDFTVNVSNLPVFLSPSVVPFTVGNSSSSQITTTGPAVDIGGATLPSGLTFTAGNPATISGTPAAGTGGTSTVLLSATDSYGTASQVLTVEIDERPSFTSPSTAVMYVGKKSSLAVTTLGYPSVSKMPNPTGPPLDPRQGLGMHFDVYHLPEGFTASNLDPQGYATGTLTITGTPTQAGTSLVSIVANNGLGQVKQDLTLSFQETADVPTNGICNGVYHGNYTGNLTIQTGESCTFISGGVSGNITVNMGGSLTLDTAAVGGNVAVEPHAAAIDIETAKIGGVLSIDGTSASTPVAKVCHSHIGSDLRLDNNKASIQVGGVSSDPCQGNTIAGNVGVNYDSGTTILDGNTVGGSSFRVSGDSGPTQIFNNRISGTLDCTGNASITGGANTASQKLDQCAAF